MQHMYLLLHYICIVCDQPSLQSKNVIETAWLQLRYYRTIWIFSCTF